MPRPSARPPSARPCALWPSRARTSKPQPSCSAPAIFWFANAQAINALRGPLTEFGVIAAKGPVHPSTLMAALEDPASDLPQAARGILAVLVEELRSLDERVAGLDREIARHATESPVARRLMTIPGIGAVTAAALTALAPPAETFRRGRDFAAWLGLTPVQRSSGGKERLGRTSKMGERSLRRLLIIGASAVARWAA